MLNRLRAICRHDNGFTIVEPLLAVVILGTLSGIAATAVSGSAERADAAACKLDKKSVEDAATAYHATNGTYAPSIDALVTADFLRDAPTTSNGYTITYDSSGTIGVAPGGPCS
jgi:prepilin-type N-terminal cleavage/methylation domain-containing protein